jgi:DNA polymerase-1
LLALFKKFEFRSWVAELEKEGTLETAQDGEVPAQSRPDNTHYETILTDTDFQRWLEVLKKADLIAFDTETTSLDYIDARVVGVSFAVSPGEAAYVPFGHDYLGVPAQLTEEQVLGGLKALLENPDVRKVGQNLKYDQSVLANHGITLHGIAYDTMLESYVLNSVATRHDMDSLAFKYLDKSTVHFEEIAGKGAKQLTFNQLNLEQAGPYAAEDADVALVGQCSIKIGA